MTSRWVLEPAPRGQRAVDDLMGWTGSDDTTQQIALSFATRQQAITRSARLAAPASAPSRAMRPGRWRCVSTGRRRRARHRLQSGRAKTERPLGAEEPAPRGQRDGRWTTGMGWTGSDDTTQQIKLSFATRQQAVAYAKRKGFAYVVDEPQTPPRTVRQVLRCDNFPHSERKT